VKLSLYETIDQQAGSTVRSLHLVLKMILIWILLPSSS
jgi:hypothetical protein